jgi:hypothetical protein
VVGAADAVDRQGLRAHIAEGSEPFLEDRPHVFVALQVDAADSSGAIVEIEVGREVVVFG